MFAYAVLVGENIFCVDDRNSILVTISDELNIVIPALTTSTANYLDINISQIEEIVRERKEFNLPSSSSPSKQFEVLTIVISKSSEWAYYFNARGLFANSIDLVFTSALTASTVQQSIASIRSRIASNLRTSQSGPVDVSEQLLEGFHEPSALQLATQRSEELSIDLTNATSDANETPQKHNLTSGAYLSLPECDESPLEDFDQLQLKASVTSPHDAHTPQPMPSIYGAMSPVEPHQFGGLSLKLTAFEYDFEETSDDEVSSSAERLGGPSLSKSAQANWDFQRTLVNSFSGHRAVGSPGKVPSIEQDESHDRLYHAKPRTYKTQKERANQANPHPYERLDQRGASKFFPPPDTNVGKLDRQGLTKLSQRMRRNVGEPPVGLSAIPEPTLGDVTKMDKSKCEDPRPAFGKTRLLPNRQPRNSEVSRARGKGQAGGTSKTASTDPQDRGEDDFDIPSSPKKAPNVPTAIMYAQSSLEPGRHPKVKPILPPMLMLGCSSKRPESRMHEGRRPNSITGKTASIPSKRIRNNEGDDAMDHKNRNAGFVDQARESEGPQRQRKKQLNRKSQPRTKPIKAKDDLAFSTHKAQNVHTDKSRNTKAVPVPLAQSRGRRVAALNANRKIQGLVESDASEEEDDEPTQKKEISTPRPGEKDRTPTSHASDLMGGNSRVANGNSRPLPISSGDSEGRIKNNEESAPITLAPPCATPTRNETRVDGSSDNVDLLIREILPPENEVTQGANTGQPLPVNASDTVPLDCRSGHELESELPNVKFKILEVQDSTSATFNNNTSLVQGLVHNKTVPLPTLTYKTVVPEVHRSDYFDATGNLGGGFFEDATAFSREDTNSSVKNPTDEEGTTKPPTLDSNVRDVHNPNAGESAIIEKISRVTDACTNPIKSTPKFSIEAKVQSTLSSVNNSNFPITTGKIPQEDCQAQASILTKMAAPSLNKTIRDEIAAGGTKKASVSNKQAGGLDAMRPDLDLETENDVPGLNQTLPPRKLQQDTVDDSALLSVTKSSQQRPTTSTPVQVQKATPYALEAANVTESGQRGKATSINEISLEGFYKSPNLRSRNPGSGMTDEGLFRGSLKRPMPSAIRVEHVQHGQQGGSKKGFSSAKTANTPPKSTRQSLLFKDEAIRADEPMTAPLDSNRKPNVISFDSKGPRNQGTVSSRKVKPIQEVEAEQPEMSWTVKDRTLKRKIQDFQDNLSLVQHDAVVKRPRTSIDVPQTRDKAPQIQKRNISIIKESTQKPSSQSSRCDENGSPLPFVHSRRMGFQRNGRQILFENTAQSPDAKEGAQDGYELQDGLGVLNLGLPLQDLSPPPASTFRIVPSTCTKQRPSSPNAPSSIIEEYTAHKVGSSDKFVNIRTDNVVMAVRPADPFVGIQQNHQNIFMELLRRSSNVDRSTSANAPTVDEDPEKTLVTDGQAQDKNILNTAPSTSASSSSDSSQSNEHSPPAESSSSESGSDEEDGWFAALQPHQGETLEVLLEISHVSQALLSLELFVVD